MKHACESECVHRLLLYVARIITIKIYYYYYGYSSTNVFVVLSMEQYITTGMSGAVPAGRALLQIHIPEEYTLVQGISKPVDDLIVGEPLH